MLLLKLSLKLVLNYKTKIFFNNVYFQASGFKEALSEIDLKADCNKII